MCLSRSDLHLKRYFWSSVALVCFYKQKKKNWSYIYFFDYECSLPGMCPTQTAYTALSIVHIHRPGRKGTLHTHTHTHTHTHLHRNTHTPTHTHTHTYMHTYAHTCTRTRARERDTHTHTHTCARTHTHTHILLLRVSHSCGQECFLQHLTSADGKRRCAGEVLASASSKHNQIMGKYRPYRCFLGKHAYNIIQIMSQVPNGP